MNNLTNSTFLYLPLKLHMSEDIREESIKFFNSLDESLWNPNKFRNSYFLTLYTREISEVSNLSSKDNLDLKWMMNKTPIKLRKWLEDTIFPLFQPYGRVALIKSFPMEKMNVHVDASKDYFDQMLMEPKFRYVIDGTLDDLYFETDAGNIKVNPCSSAYIMDGAWPHYAINNSGKPRYVLGIGRPWLGQINDKLRNVIDLSLKELGNFAIDRSDMNRKLNQYDLYTNT